jgi:hypothetical protein
MDHQVDCGWGSFFAVTTSVDEETCTLGKAKEDLYLSLFLLGIPFNTLKGRLMNY